ncbi:MAG: alpha/beta fold hydrolase [Pseudomonadota bacterium]
MFKPPLRDAVFVDGPAGKLELLVAEAAEADAPVAVICHPHPVHGGAMTNKVTHTLARAYERCGYHAVRFNFRGVGHSDGAFDDGVGELADLLAVMDWARAQFATEHVALGGFSFGAAMALHASAQRAVTRLILVAPPVGRILAPEARVPAGFPVLVVQGGADDVVDPEAVVTWVNDQAAGIELAWMEEAGHFFHGLLPDLRTLLIDHITADAE